MKFVSTIEFDIEPNIHSQITDLRNLCFPDCQSDRSYYKNYGVALERIETDV